ncbi:heparinase [Rhizobium sp. Root274]|uniref:heparinase II/III family protein n=1 Tax=unclassified Rhizobium TaxID=2613769 RepID=UPI00071447CD|nr:MULTISPECIES: heparinase II/III family protein [unclassified Rhizobium]KQW27966.1 heparinase [Rhizobium sp. Root1240]KRD28246.1 heparinase [Rhizobium sp. Root274]
MRISDRRKLIGLYLDETWRRTRQAVALTVPPLLGIGSFKIARVVVAPTDLRAVDPFVAEEILQGRYPLAGRVLDAGGDSPFSLELPTHQFALRLHGFGWLRHIRADKTPEACDNARWIVDQWIGLHGVRATGVAWDPEVLSRRIISWLSHSPVVLQEAEVGFYRRFIGSLNSQLRYLQRRVDHLPEGLPRLKARIALAMASISTEAKPSIVRRTGRQLDRELERQILPDGTHISRNPQACVDLLFDLLPLRQTYINLGHDLPQRLISVVDRIYPAVRFFRHSGGDLALFNGASSTLATDLMSVLRYDETAGQPFKALPHGGYHRLSGGDTVLLVDAGKPKSMRLSASAHAGCLSFELSSGRNRFIINSGLPRFAGEKLRQLARTTAAHSTVSVGDVSSARVMQSDYLGPVFTVGPSTVDVDRQSGPDGSDRLSARHDGYLKRFGILHEREIRMNQAGNKIAGRDRLLQPDGQPVVDLPSAEAIARFHIHPSITLEQLDSKKVRLSAPDGESWNFSIPLGELTLEEDVFFADVSGIRPSRQIEIRFAGPEIRWFLAHHA